MSKFIQFKNGYDGGWILINTDHVQFAYGTTNVQGHDVTILQIANHEGDIILDHPIDEVHAAFDNGGL